MFESSVPSILGDVIVWKRVKVDDSRFIVVYFNGVDIIIDTCLYPTRFNALNASPISINRVVLPEDSKDNRVIVGLDFVYFLAGRFAPMRIPYNNRFIKITYFS